MHGNSSRISALHCCAASARVPCRDARVLQAWLGDVVGTMRDIPAHTYTQACCSLLATCRQVRGGTPKDLCWCEWVISPPYTGGEGGPPFPACTGMAYRLSCAMNRLSVHLTARRLQHPKTRNFTPFLVSNTAKSATRAPPQWCDEFKF